MVYDYVNLHYDGRYYPIDSMRSIDEQQIYCYYNYLSQRYPTIFYDSYKMPLHFLPLSFIDGERFIKSVHLEQDSFLLEMRFDDLLSELFSEDILPFPSIVSGIFFTKETPVSYVIYVKEGYLLDIYFCPHLRNYNNLELKNYFLLPKALDIFSSMSEKFDIQGLFHAEPYAFHQHLTLTHLLMTLEYLIEHFPTITPPLPRLVDKKELKYRRSLIHFVDKHQPCARKSIVCQGFFKISR